MFVGVIAEKLAGGGGGGAFLPEGSNLIKTFITVKYILSGKILSGKCFR